jgi:hypothetical protein
MIQYKLKENHPFAIKVRKLEDLMNELGIRIEVNYQGQIILTDTNEGIDYQYKDIEQSYYSQEITNSFPYMFETKLVFEQD